MTLETAIQEAVRGGYAYQRGSLKATRNSHAVHAEGTRRMYLCQCNRGFIFPAKPSKLGRKRNKDHRWADDFRYR